MAEPQRIPHRIITDYETFGCGFDVTVSPVPIGIDYARHFKHLAEARDYAERLSASTGWPQTDHCDDEVAL